MSKVKGVEAQLALLAEEDAQVKRLCAMPSVGSAQMLSGDLAGLVLGPANA